MQTEWFIVACALSSMVRGWDYANPDWSGDAAVCGNGIRQSPIAINECDAFQDGSLGAFTFSNYETNLGSMTLKNSGGHTAQVDITSEHTVAGGGLTGTYKVAQIHFHWGFSDITGSEHTIDGKQYPLELHIVHYKSTHADLSAAIASGDGDALAVIGIMYELSATDNANLAPIITGLGSITAVDASTTVSGFSLYDVSLSNLGNQPYYRYLGSLTTPTCNEVVIWTVMKTKSTISSSQLNTIRNAINDQGDSNKLKFNFRQIQNLYTRSVYVTTSAAAGNSALVGVTVLSVISTVVLGLSSRA